MTAEAAWNGKGSGSADICNEIRTARTCGVVRCGLSARTIPTISELARECGLKADPACYKEIDKSAARRLIQLVLHEDLAYRSQIMPADRAAKFADSFLRQFGTGVRYFTNGLFHEGWHRLSGTVVAGPSWDPVTEATFDTGVLVVGELRSGCLWVEDED
jgi:hypothetical protein